MGPLNDVWFAPAHALTILLWRADRLRYMPHKIPEPPGEWLHRIALRGVIGSLLFILLLTLMPNGTSRGNLLLVPLQDLRRAAGHGHLMHTLLFDIAGNVALFAPLGFFLPLAVPWIDSWKRILLVSCALSVSVEAAQYLLPIGRIAATTDVLLNTLGGVCGYILLCAVRLLLPADIPAEMAEQESA